jgi:nitrate/TMAO reductase-like tetraheme cytochrome c subunit
MNMRNLLTPMTRNPISLVGTALMLISAILFASLLAIELLGGTGNPYTGIITYLILPAVGAFGFVLVLFGIRRERKRAPGAPFPVVDLNVDSVRNRLILFVIFVSVGAVILAAATYEGFHLMESESFCGETCHSVMGPEFAAYQRSPHARVACVECHIGSGTKWMVKMKLNGAWQMISTILDLYERPIPTPVHNLRPSRGTCEECHWPEKFYGVNAKLITHYSPDAANTELKTILLMKTGGNDFSGSHGIHWHMDPEIQIRYRADEKRQTMFKVELTEADGTIKTYLKQNIKDRAGEPEDWRVMDCIDCHNRPTHQFFRADEAVDLALKRNFIAQDLPFIRREGEKALRAEYESQEAAKEGIAAHTAEFYRREYPQLATTRKEDILEAGRVLSAFYSNNVYPDMKIEWGSYPDHSGHHFSPGCNRCHAGDHEAENGEVISADCSVCHTIVAWEEASPEILALIPRD